MDRLTIRIRTICLTTKTKRTETRLNTISASEWPNTERSVAYSQGEVWKDQRQQGSDQNKLNLQARLHDSREADFGLQAYVRSVHPQPASRQTCSRSNPSRLADQEGTKRRSKKL